MENSCQILPVNLSDTTLLNSLVEHRRVFNLKNCELNIYETFHRASNVKLSFNGLAVSSMMRGKKWMSLEDEDKFDFLPGESVILPEGKTMKVDFPEADIQRPVQCATITMNWDVVQANLDFLNQYYPTENEGKQWELNFNRYHFLNNKELSYSINKLIKISMEEHSGKDAIADLALKILLLRIIQTQNLVNVNDQKIGHDRFASVIQYIEQNIDKNIKTDDLVKKAVMNKAAFFQQFKLEFGMTPINFIHQKRVENSKSLLVSTELNVNEIAFGCGFNNMNYFSKIFKRHTGYTPTEYREGILM